MLDKYLKEHGKQRTGWNPQMNFIQMKFRYLRRQSQHHQTFKGPSAIKQRTLNGGLSTLLFHQVLENISKDAMQQ
jgi:hypothetical protein